MCVSFCLLCTVGVHSPAQYCPNCSTASHGPAHVHQCKDGFGPINSVAHTGAKCRADGSTDTPRSDSRFFISTRQSWKLHARVNNRTTGSDFFNKLDSFTDSFKGDRLLRKRTELCISYDENQKYNVYPFTHHRCIYAIRTPDLCGKCIVFCTHSFNSRQDHSYLRYLNELKSRKASVQEYQCYPMTPN